MILAENSVRGPLSVTWEAHRQRNQGCCSMVTVMALEAPVTPSAIVLMGTPGIEAGAKLTLPSRAEVAVAVCVASNGAWVQRP